MKEWTSLTLRREVYNKLINLQYKLFKEEGKKYSLSKIIDMLIEGKI